LNARLQRTEKRLDRLLEDFHFTYVSAILNKVKS